MGFLKGVPPLPDASVSLALGSLSDSEHVSPSQVVGPCSRDQLGSQL